MAKHIKLILRGFGIFARFPRPVLLSMTLSILFQASIPFVNIWFSARIINELVGTRDQSRLVFLVALTICINLAANLAGSLLNRWQTVCQSLNWSVMTNLVTDKMLSMDYADVESPGVQESRSSIAQHQNGMGFGLNRLIGTYTGLVGGFIRLVLSVVFAFTLFTLPVPEEHTLAFLNSPISIAIVLLILLCNILLGPLIMARGGKIWAKASDLNNKYNRLFGFYFFTMTSDNNRAKDMRIYNQHPIITETSRDHFTTNAWIKFATYFDRHNAANGAITQITSGAIYLFVALKAVGGAFPVGNIVQYAGAVLQFGEGFGLLIMNAAELVNNNPYLEKVVDFLAIESKSDTGTRSLPQGTVEIEFHNVSFRYPSAEKYALHNVSMKLNTAQRLAVVGMNGSGKTTMIKLLCRLYDPTEGKITLNGIDIKEYKRDEYFKLYSVVFQDFELLPFTLGQNVSVDTEFDADRVHMTLSQAGFGEKLESMPHGLDTYLYKNFTEDGVDVSGGEAQKIALARALYKNSPFIILDEPTAALDPIAEYEIYNSFNEIVEEKTAVYISHRLSSCRFCDDIAVFHEGELVQRGGHDELAGDASGKYKELWDAQAQYYS